MKFAEMDIFDVFALPQDYKFMKTLELLDALPLLWLPKLDYLPKSKKLNRH